MEANKVSKMIKPFVKFGEDEDIDEVEDEEGEEEESEEEETEDEE